MARDNSFDFPGGTFHHVDSTASSSPATVDGAQGKRAMQTISSQSMMDHGAASCTVIYDLSCMKGGGERRWERTCEARSRPQTAQQRAWRSWRFIGGDMGHFMYRHSSASLSRLCEQDQIPGYFTLSYM